MAEKRISELTAKGSSLAANDLVEVSEYVSPGVYRTRYVTGTEVAGISGNFANTDLTFTANRNHDVDGYNLTFTDMNDFTMNSDVAGYSFSYKDLGNSIPEFVIDCASGGQSRFHMRNNGTDAMVSYTIGTSLWEQYREWQVRSIVTNNIHMIRDIEGRWLFSNDATGTDTPATDTRIKVASDGLDYALKTDARVLMASLPTSSAGLATGELWNNSGVINIV